MTPVVFVNRAGRVSGAEVVMLELIDVAMSRGLDVHVVCPSGSLVDRLPPGVEHVLIDELDFGGTTGLARAAALLRVLGRWVRAARAIRRAAGSNGVVIVNSLMALPAARMAHVRGGVSWLVHDTVCDSKQKSLIRFSRNAIRRAVAVSPPTAEPVRALGIDVVSSPLGVAIPPARVDRDERGTPVVGIMGLLTPWKGHRVLLEALSRLPDVHCEVAGSAFYTDQPYADELNELAMQPALAGRVKFLGHVEPLSVIHDWDVLVSASTSPEAGPIVALEAMSLGVPVIGTNHGGCAWLLRDGAGVLVPPGDCAALATAIESVLANPSAALEMTTVARQRVLDHHDASRAFPAMFDALVDGLRSG